VNAATMSVSYTAKQTFNGTVTYAVGGTSVFTTTYSTNYEAAPSLAAITGTFTGQVAAFTGGIQDAALTVSSTGVLSGGGGGCAITGLISPRTDGNAYNISIKFGAQPCMFTNQTIAGVAYFDAATKAIYVVAPNAGRTDGVIFVGSMAAAATAAGTLNSIAVTPGASIAVGSIQQLAATGTYVTPASTADVSTLVTWSSSNTAVATVSINGLVTGVAAGTAVITASKPGVVSAIANVTVTAATPAGSIIDPTLVGTWKRNASSLMRTFNVDGSFDMVSLYMNFGSCFSIYRMENIRYGVASTSGTALTLNTTGGTLKTWSCTYVYNALVPTTTSSVTPGTSSYTWRIVGSGVGATLYLNDGTGEDPYTKQ
jgi:hypothetical protein